MSEVTVENVNVARVMGAEGAQDAVDKIQAAMEENPAVKKLMDAAASVEDMYQVAKEYVKIKLEDFKVLWDKTVAYFKEEKAALSDEVMDSVVGGWSFRQWFDEHKKQIAATCVLVACVATGAICGGILGGFGGAMAGAIVGTVVGGVCGFIVKDGDKQQKK